MVNSLKPEDIPIPDDDDDELLRDMPTEFSEEELGVVLQGTHQFGIVPGGCSLAHRVVQVLERIPPNCSVHLHAGSRHDLLQESDVVRALELCKADDVTVSVVEGGQSGSEEFVLYFDLPDSSLEFINRLRHCRGAVRTYTLLQQADDSLKIAREVVGSVFKKAQAQATGYKVIELRSAVGQVTAQDFDETENDGEGKEEDEECDAGNREDDDDAQWCSLWPPYRISSELDAEFQEDDGVEHDCCMLCTCINDGGAKVMKRQYGQHLEVVCIDLSAVQDGLGDDFKALRDLAKPDQDPSYTIIALHHYGSHDLQEKHKHLRQYLPATEWERARVVFINAMRDEDGSPSWHDYQDAAMMDETLGDDAGATWIDILDEQAAPGGGKGMVETNRLLAQVVGLEIEWLQGKSHRVILSGASQGGGMAFYHFLTSAEELGGFVGCVCHVPTSPHLPRSQDPLLHNPVNRHRPVRLMSAGQDTCFALGLVQRDLLRLKDVGGFTNVGHRIMDECDHYMEDHPDLDLKYLQEVLPAILKD